MQFKYSIVELCSREQLLSELVESHLDMYN